MWATDGVAPEVSGPTTGPFVGKLAAIPDEPAFAGRVRMAPGDEATFDTSKVRSLDEDDDVLPARRGSRAGMLVLVMALFVMAAAAAVVYVFVIRKGKEEHVALPVKDAGTTATVTPDAAAIVPPVTAIDAAPPTSASPLDAARGELWADVEPRLRTAAQSLDGKADAPSQALRAHMLAQLAQDLQDRASVIADKSIAEQLRKEAKQIVLDAATAAQRALKTAADDAGANLAMGEVMRLQGKPTRESKHYLDIARDKANQDLARDLALADALILVRDNKLDDAKAAFTAIDQGDGKLEASGDVRARFHLALVLAAQNKAADAKPLVATILAAQPEHTGAKALADKLETLVTKTDPLPPEDGSKDGSKDGSGSKNGGTGKVTSGGSTGPGSEVSSSGGGESYDRLLARANAVADSNCVKAMDLYAKALEQKPNGVEALTGMGYCHIDAKQFASAFSKFRAALAVSSRYEPALRGVAEAYQQQGLKDRAIEAYKAYLEVFPDSAMAKKQLERLGGDTAAPPPSGNGGGAATPPAPTPAPPPPAPTPAPSAPTQAPSGAGSDSG
jgi:tetratricopeptide (TPR) repeat protein